MIVFPPGADSVGDVGGRRGLQPRVVESERRTRHGRGRRGQDMGLRAGRGPYI